MGAPDVERAQLRPGGLAFRTEDAAGLHLIGFAEEFHEDGDALDVATPSETRLLLLEVSLLQVVLECPIGLRGLVPEGEADDQIDVGRADVRPRALRELTDEVPRGEAAGQIFLSRQGPRSPSSVTRARSQRAVVASS